MAASKDDTIVYIITCDPSATVLSWATLKEAGSLADTIALFDTMPGDDNKRGAFSNLRDYDKVIMLCQHDGPDFVLVVPQQVSLSMIALLPVKIPGFSRRWRLPAR